MEKLLEFTLSQHLSRYLTPAHPSLSQTATHSLSSSVNLIAAMGAIANIARQRPDYMSRVVQTFEALQGNELVSLLRCYS
jgi:hypothetical protein